MDQIRLRIIMYRLVCAIVLMFASTAATRQQAANAQVHALRRVAKYTRQQAKLRRIALKRFAMLDRIEETHIFYLGTMPGEYAETIGFPVGRADRIYLLYGDSVICYQHKNGKDKRVYKIVLQDYVRKVTQVRPVIKTQIRSLFDYLTQESEFQTSTGDKRAGFDALSKGTSKFAKRDLATIGHYVEYSSDVMNDVLTVCLINDDNNGKHASTVDYDPSLDPFTRAPIPDFYQRYGLPVIPVEAAILDHKPLR